MTKKKLINLSKGEENINSDCQSIEEPKGWRFNWRKVIPLEPTAELIILVLLALLLICPLSSRQGAYQDSHGVVCFILIKQDLLLKEELVLFHFATFNHEVISFSCITVSWTKCFFIIFVEEILFTKFLNVFIDKVKEFFVTFLNGWGNGIWVTK